MQALSMIRLKLQRFFFAFPLLPLFPSVSKILFYQRESAAMKLGSGV
jgi:hypothetical protein